MKEVILGIGNILKGDDGIGIYIAEKLNKYFNEAKFAEAKREVIVLDCGTIPENYTSVIRKHNPDTLILVDAADMGLNPGSFRIIPPERIEVMYFSTHAIPLSIFMSYVSEFCGEIVLIGIQPDRMDIGTTLSSVVQKNGDQVVKLMIEGRLSEIHSL